jgi:hypothetical protein
MFPVTGDQPCHKAAPYTGRKKQKKTSMLRVGFESTIPVFERAKTIYAVDRATIVIGKSSYKRDN